MIWDLKTNSRLTYQGLGMPDEFRTSLVYDFFDYAIMSAATTGSLLVAGNSLFDPDKTGSGHQPLFFDALGGGIYNRYRCYGSRVVVTLLNASQSFSLTCTPTTNSSYPATLNDALESRYTTQMIVASTVFRAQLDNQITTHKVWGVPKSVVVSDDLYQSLYTTDPVRLWYWKILCGVYDGTTGMSLRINVKVIYDVCFSELSIYSQS